MVNLQIDIHGLTELQAKLKRMDDSLTEELSRTTFAALDSIVKPEARRYPGQSGRKMKFVSEKQRRYVMMLLRQGKIPYRRTYRLQGSFSTEVSPVGADIVGTLGTSIPYAPWVIGHKAAMGAGPQAAYHKGNWRTLGAALRGKQREIRDLFRNMIQRLLRK